MVAPLFSPFQLGPVALPNRLAVAPMCQYSAADGCATDWHLQHLMSLAMSGAGLVTVEATAVERAGRITHHCLGLYSDANEYALARVLAAARSVALPGTRFAIQIAHAGRKASSQVPWQGGGALQAGQDPWPVWGPSAVPMGPGWQSPQPLDEAGIARVEQAFLDAVARAVRIGFDVIELHMAHGYLLHSFASPVSNQRDDAYGGSRDRRHALPVRIARSVAASVPAHVAVGARITGSDWVEDGIQVEDTVALAGSLREAGLEFVCVSSGGVSPQAVIPVGPLYQVPFAREVRSRVGIATRAVGMIRTAQEANEVIANGDADLVALGRPFLSDPRWGWYAADVLGYTDQPRPPQYARALRGSRAVKPI